MRKSNIIRKYVTEKGICTGCGVCASLFGEDKISIEMKKSGFYRPVFKKDLSNEEWEKLEHVCPALNMKYETYTDVNTPLFGKAVACRVGWSASEEIRFKASSGGAVTSFLLFLLEQKKIDGVIHAGRYDNQLEAEGVLSVTAEEIKQNMGSLYMPAALLKNLETLLNKSEKVAVVGKGCDIRAVRRFVACKPQYKSKIVVCIGILCGGTPSMRGTHNILEKFGVKEDEIELFRYRGHGWPGKCTLVTKQNSIKQMSYNEAWADWLGPTSPLVCKVCFDGIADAADIVFGDAWKCEDGNYPSFKEADGRNLIVCRTGQGKYLLDEAVSSGYMELSNEHIDNEQFKIIQPSQSNRRYLAKLKMLGLRMIGFAYPRTNFKYLDNVSKASGVKTSIVQKVRTVCGSIKRAGLGKEEKE